MGGPESAPETVVEPLRSLVLVWLRACVVTSVLATSRGMMSVSRASQWDIRTLRGEAWEARVNMCDVCVE